MSRRTLVILTAYDPALPGTRTLYLTDGTGFVTTPSETPASQVFDPVLAQPLDLATRVQGLGSGAVLPAFGTLEVENRDGQYDAWAGYAFDGRSLVVREGPLAGAYPADYPIVFSGTLDRVDLTTDRVVLRVRDGVAALEAPLQDTAYLGDNVAPDGLEGDAALADVPKPLAFGLCRGIPAVEVNSVKLIYQLADNDADTVLGVSDGTVALGPYAPSDYQQVNGTTGGDCAASDGTTLVVGDINAGNPAIRTTSDGVTYSLIGSLPFVSAGRTVGMAYSATDDRFCAVTDGGEIATSDDAGATWTLRTSPAATAYVRVRYCTRRAAFVAVGSGGAIHTSPTGATWTAQTSGTANTLNDIAVDGPLLVAVGASGTIVTAPDLTTWTATTRGTTSRVAAHYDGLAYYATGPAGYNIFRSVDGLEWAVVEVNDQTATFVVEDFASASGYTVALLRLGNQAYATAWTRDGGLTWTPITGVRSGGSLTLTIVAHADRFYVVARTHTYRSGAAGTYANLTDLEDDTLAPAPGTFKWIASASGTYVRLGTPPVGPVTATVRQGATDADRTAAQLFVAVLTQAGYTSGDWNASDITALDTADNSVCGLYVEGTETVGECLDALARTVGAWWGVDANGVFRVQQLTAPSGSSTFSVAATDILALERLASSDPLIGRPSFRTTLRYALTDTVTLDGTARDEDAAVLTVHPLAQATEEDTLFVEGADALAEAQRRQTLRGTQREAYRVTVPLADFASVALGAVGTLTHPRFGLAGGVLVRCLGREPDARARRLTLTLWR